MICPNCGFDVKRNPNGMGTKIDPRIPLSFTENQVFQFGVVADYDSLNVREIQKRLADFGIKKNYHQVQAALSTLVGRGIVKMNVEVFPPRYYR